MNVRLAGHHHSSAPHRAARHPQVGAAPTVSDPYVRLIVDAAVRRGLAVEVLDADDGELRLATADGRTVTTRSSLSERTSAVAMWRCQDKLVTRRVLGRHGIVVPRGRQASFDDVDERFLDDVGEAVVKPVVGESGDGVTVGVTTPAQLREATAKAVEVSPRVLIEERSPGDDVRVVVIGGEVVAAAVRRPAAIVGDGQHTVRQLVRRDGAGVAMGELLRVLARNGRQLDTIPDDGERVALAAVSNVHKGGSITDVTDTLSEALRQVAIDVAAAIEIPVVGVDLMAPDVTGDRYAVIEANERPGLANHEPHPTAERFLDVLFPAVDSPGGV